MPIYPGQIVPPGTKISGTSIEFPGNLASAPESALRMFYRRVPSSSFFASANGYTRWSFGYNPESIRIFDTVSIIVQTAKYNDTVKLRVWSRLRTSAYVDTAPDSSQAGDTFIVEKTYYCSNFSQIDYFSEMKLVLDAPLTMLPANQYLFEVVPDRSSTPKLGMIEAVSNGTDFTGNIGRGAYKTTGGWTYVTTGHAVYFGLGLSAGQDVQTRIPSGRDDISISPDVTTLELNPTYTGITFPTVYVYRDGQKILISDPGGLTSLAAAANTSRYDLVQLNIHTLIPSKKAGTARAADPNSYIPVPDASCVPLYLTYSTSWSQELIPCDFDGNVGMGRETEYTRWTTRGRQALQKTRAKLAQKTNIVIAGYGDSITAMGAYDVGNPYVADGITRDNWDSYYANYPSDTKALYTLYDHGDGGGAVHTHTGMNYLLKTWLDAVYGITTVYHNYGMGGTTSGPASTVSSGLYADRIAVPLAATPDLLILEFGMNELGSAYDTYTNVKGIIAQFLAIGTEVIVLGVPRPKFPIIGKSIESWLYTNRALKSAAYDSGAAFAPTTYFTDQYHLGGMGIATGDYATANGINHPGVYEHSRYAELLKALLSV